MKVNLIVGELPPRARRIQLPKIQRFAHVGTTSACAENTLEGRPETLIFWNYLRVRGEYRGSGGLGCFSWELPPRARRILLGVCIRWGVFGTTSACAENTPRLKTATRPPWNYLRVRGEYSLVTSWPRC